MKLRKYLDDRRMKHGDFAAKVPISEGHLSNLLSGKRIPSARLMKRINAATGGKVGLKDWGAEDEPVATVD